MCHVAGGLSATAASSTSHAVLPSAHTPALSPCLTLLPPLSHAGLFLAPQTTGEALKGGRLVAEVMAREGYTVIPVSG
jgi:hypothetical protein